MSKAKRSEGRLKEQDFQIAMRRKRNDALSRQKKVRKARQKGFEKPKEVQ